MISRSLAFIVTSSKSQPVRDVLRLYQCTLIDPPERVENPRVVKMAKLVTTFNDMPREKVRSKWNKTLKKNVYVYEYSVSIRLRSEEGTLQFNTEAYGMEKGKTTVKFNSNK